MSKIATTVGEDKRRASKRRTSVRRPGFFSLLASLIFKEVSSTRQRNHSARQSAIAYNRRKRDEAAREWKRRQRDAERSMNRQQAAQERVRRQDERAEPDAREAINPSTGRPYTAEQAAAAGIGADTVGESAQEELSLELDGQPDSQTELPLDSFGMRQAEIPFDDMPWIK